VSESLLTTNTRVFPKCWWHTAWLDEILGTETAWLDQILGTETAWLDEIFGTEMIRVYPNMKNSCNLRNWWFFNKGECMKTQITRNDPQSWFNLLWECIDFYRESVENSDDYEFNRSQYDENLDDLATAMAWIAEDLNELGDYVIDDQP
jgi:hypothetical protein